MAYNALLLSDVSIADTHQLRLLSAWSLLGGYRSALG